MKEPRSWADHVVFLIQVILLMPLQILVAPFFVGFIAVDAVRKREPSRSL